MRLVLILTLCLSLAACSNVTCSDRQLDGGIGGTGECTSEIPAQAPDAEVSEPLYKML